MVTWKFYDAGWAVLTVAVTVTEYVPTSLRLFVVAMLSVFKSSSNKITVELGEITSVKATTGSHTDGSTVLTRLTLWLY